MKRIKRLLLLAAMGTLPFTAMQAEDGVVVTLRNGTTVGFAFSTRPVMVTGETLEMRTTNGTVSYAYADIRKVTWTVDLVNEIKSVTADAPATVVFRVTPEGITAQGMQPGETMTAYTVDGRLVGRTRAAGTEATLSLPQGKAVYIVRTSTGVSYKFARQ